ncbi:hypothetical protein [Roseomonas sp. USHLN139]|uniref:hypothetical protein n=1 Tax=Roseomonas sp. USHLN139 TaxID=3081298 RepID=UPI003B01E961
MPIAAEQERIRRAIARTAAQQSALQRQAGGPEDAYHRKVRQERQEAEDRLFRLWRGPAPKKAAAAPPAKSGNAPLLYGLAGAAGAALLIIVVPWLISLAPGRFLPQAASLPAAASLLGYSSAAAFQSDQRAARDALKTAMAAGPGTQEKWTNPETGNLGLLWVEGQVGGMDGDCRKVTQRMNVQRSLWETSFTSCRQGGSWSSDLGWENAGRPSLRPPRSQR